MCSALSGDLGTQRWVSLCWWSSTKGSSPRKGSNIDAESTWPVWSLCKDFRRTWWRGCSLRNRFIFLSLASPHNPTQPLVTENMPLAPPLSCFVCLSKSQCSNQHTGSGSFQGWLRGFWKGKCCGKLPWADPRWVGTFLNYKPLLAGATLS